MKILVLGNGFDLDHELPTSYKDFLNFCNYVIAKSISDDTDFALEGKQLEYYQRLKSQNNLGQFEKLVCNNNLLNYFIDIQKGKNWVDLESEINNLVDCFVALEKDFLSTSKTEYLISKKEKAISLCQKLNIPAFLDVKHHEYIVNEIRLKALYQSLFSYLEQISKALELYISDFIDQENIESFSPDVADFLPNKVISFNYSSTYERFYSITSSRGKVDYIHGKANGFKYYNQPGNIVLGITSSAPIESDYVHFEKYYQRIVKKTGAKYKDWLRDNKGKLEVAFFGHSLDSTDKDILLDLIEHKNSFVTIFYYNDESYKNIIANLNRVLGKDKLIQYVYGTTPKIVFSKQREACNSKSKGWEIKQDISKIKQLNRFDEKATYEIIGKILKNFDEENVNYFFNQENLITLVDAFALGKITHLLDKNKIIRICSKLDYAIEDGCLVEYNVDDWGSVDYKGEIEYQQFTSELINKINALNKNHYQSTPHSGLSYSIRKISMATDNSKSELTQHIIDIITDEEFFENNQFVNQLIYACKKNKTILSAIKDIAKSSDSTLFYMIKANNFLDKYYEFIYIEERQKEQSQHFYSDVL